MGAGGIIDQVHDAHAGDRGGGIGHRATGVAGDQQMHLAHRSRGGDRRQRRLVQRDIVMLDPDQRLHAATPRARSATTSASTSPTRMPACRAGGSDTFSVRSRGDTSTPKSAGDLTTSGFFFAFMMLGSEA